MNKIFDRLFVVMVGVIWLCLAGLGALIGVPSFHYTAFLLAGLFMAALLRVIIGKILLRPIRQMQKAAANMSQGDFTHRFDLSRRDELRDLAQQLNQVSDELQGKIRRIMRDKNELMTILSSMVEGVLVIGRDERVLLLNNPLDLMLDLRTKDAIGRPYWEIIRNEEINTLLREALTHKHSVKKDVSIITPAERQFSMQVSSIFSDEGELAGIVAVFHDVTELKRLARMRSEFVANVSHELKTPLTTIKGFTETLLDGALDDKDAARRFISIIQEHAQRLEYLVNDLLSLSNLETREIKLNLEKTPVHLMMESVLHLYKDQLEKHGPKIRVRIPADLPPVLVDRVKIEQAFVNLLDNAIKFTPPDGSIEIAAHRENDYVRVHFTDTGIGIAPEHLPRVFERFYRVDKGRSREMGGTGLGLSIVKHILQIHNGNVTVQSEPDKGSVFSVFLPIA
ncbi:MAG: ATP-binding protein [Candidatus Omnitrophota bacterium]|nr:ATP-binding protein [Candidatus Omnitrophota bacterium]MDZ4242786.1 ATP-binding protein [Candidatus Omnitrophota bacterium]